ncbi:Phosphoglycolate phosphatase [Planctomycetales bacterium 10988]|nr:Phosphoglycolate phosphatase [Planctomycetales bacterium 10988]
MWVLFDAVGTLIEPSPSAVEVYWKAGQKAGIDWQQQEVARRFRAAFLRQEQQDQFENQLKTDESREHLRWQTIVAEVFSEIEDSNQVFEFLWDYFAQTHAWSIYPDACETINALDEQKVPWGIASNFDRRLRTIALEMPQLSACQQLFISSEMGLRKPHPDYFQAIQQTLKIPPREILFIGDDEQNDLSARQLTEWQVLHLCRKKPDHTEGQITQLPEILPYLT